MREHKRLRIIWGRRKQESDNRINKRERRRKYEDKIYRKKILSEVRERLRLKMQENYEAENENLKIVKYIKKNYIYDFINYINNNSSEVDIKNA